MNKAELKKCAKLIKSMCVDKDNCNKCVFDNGEKCMLCGVPGEWKVN